MTKTNANMRLTLTHKEAHLAITTIGMHRTYIIKSEPGVGKTSLLDAVVDSLNAIAPDEYEGIYVDCPGKDIPDIGMNVPDMEARILRYMSSELFNMGNGKKKVIMLDEFMKSNKLLQVIWTRLMLERYVGDMKLPDGSIVFATSNNESDGVGDTMLAHAGNRVTIIELAKPTAAEWVANFASKRGISKVIQTWALMEPRAFRSYRDGGQEDNPYIFNPTKKGVMSFVSPRSLAGCDPIVKNRHILGENVTRTSLSGTIGRSAADSMAAFLSLESEVIYTKDIIADPENAPVPSKAAALCMTIVNALDDIKAQEDLSKFMTWLARSKSEEMESVFFSLVLQDERTSKIAQRNAKVAQWGARNFDLMSTI
jgi:hypothetical protein